MRGVGWELLCRPTRLSFGTVNAPGQRYHPAIIAQAAATLSEMYPERFWLALGTGEALNEHITGAGWPDKATRRARLVESAAIIRALFQGETVTPDGLVKVREARLYTRPLAPPMLFGAAVTDESAAWVGTWADGLITVAAPQEQLRRVVEQFRKGGGEGKPMLLQSAISFGQSEAAAEAAASECWRTNAVSCSAFNSDTSQPEIFDAVARFVRIEDLRQAVRISADPARHVAWLEADRQLGFERIYVHHVGKDQERFIAAFAEQVLPRCS